MKRPLFKISLIIWCLSLPGYAQNVHKKMYTEEFNTNSDVNIKVDTRYTNIIIEPWSKNSVRVEATIKVEGVSDERAEKTLENWKFKALGNKSQVEITSREENALIAANFSFDPTSNVVVGNNFKFNGSRSFSFNLNDGKDTTNVILNGKKFNGKTVVLNGRNIIHLDSIGAFSYNFPNVEAIKALTAKIPEFDYEKFEKDQNYMLQWQEEMKASMKEFVETQKELEKTAKLSANDAKRIAETQREISAKKIDLVKRNEDYQRVLSNRKIEIEKRKKESEESALANQKQSKSIVIKNFLENREKVNVTRSIVIKAPKDAKFTLDVKYGTVSFSK
ncbi:hypothetical protein MWU59_06260 [Flavobacteriaceae bacterium F08102]|nr:hypothetical protein [Flavobacteriaceae bacterium F08102]